MASSGQMLLQGPVLPALVPTGPPMDAETAKQLAEQSFTSLAANATDRSALEGLQRVHDQFEQLTSAFQSPKMVTLLYRVSQKVFTETEPQIFAETEIQQTRKMLLEMLQKMPYNEHVRPFVKNLINLIGRLIQTENDENAVIASKICFELVRQFRPAFGAETAQLLTVICSTYQAASKNVGEMFEAGAAMTVGAVVDASGVEHVYAPTQVKVHSSNSENPALMLTCLPRADHSLKILGELATFIILMYQMTRGTIVQELNPVVSSLVATISTHPTERQRVTKGFNQDLWYELITAQVKTMTCIGFLSRFMVEQFLLHGDEIVQALLALYECCPQHLPNLRRDLIASMKYLISNDIRYKFVPVLHKMFAEFAIPGPGWTAKESLRALAFSTLADLVHHVRNKLSPDQITQAVQLFCKNLHDDTLATGVQMMCSKLLLNLIEPIRLKADIESVWSRRMMLFILRSCVLKLKALSKVHLPILLAKERADMKSGTNIEARSNVLASAQDQQILALGPSMIPVGLTLTETKGLIKTMVVTSKTIVWALGTSVLPAEGPVVSTKEFSTKETVVLIELLKWGFCAFDFLVLSNTGNNSSGKGNSSGFHSAATSPLIRKEEKELIDHFAGIFGMMNGGTYKEIMEISMEHIVHRFSINPSLQSVINAFLTANQPSSAIFASVLLNFLIDRMDQLGSSDSTSVASLESTDSPRRPSHLDTPSLYLRLFKLAIGSYTLHPQIMEKAMQPVLHKIVKNAMDLALTAKDPQNYFLVMRALFRSMVGCAYSWLNQEFQPLIQMLLQGLSSLQCGLHRRQMHDLFVELCLTVPVRLSSLMPYIPLLIDPLVAALESPPNCVGYGLRTLELFADHLQPEFIYENMQPLRSRLMQALWKTLSSPNDSHARQAYRILGKLGGINRKTLIEPQELEHVEDDPFSGPAIAIEFPGYQGKVYLPVGKALETAFSAIRTPGTEEYFKRQSWELARGFLLASFNASEGLVAVNVILNSSSKLELFETLTLPDPRLPKPFALVAPWAKSSGEAVGSHSGGTRSLAPHSPYRAHHIALACMFAAAAQKELAPSVLPVLKGITIHLTLVAVANCLKPPAASDESSGVDPLVLFDVLAEMIGADDKDFCRPARFALTLVFDTSEALLGSPLRVARLPFVAYFAEAMCYLCHERAWFAKVGGCYGIRFLMNRLPLSWTLKHLRPMSRALLFILSDMTGELSHGAVDVAQEVLEELLVLCVKPIRDSGSGKAGGFFMGIDSRHSTGIKANAEIPTEALKSLQEKCVGEVLHELIRALVSPHGVVRKTAIHLLGKVSEANGESLRDIVLAHKDAVKDMVPPKRMHFRQHDSTGQIAILEANLFFANFEPPIVELDRGEHSLLSNDLIGLSEMSEMQMMKMASYKNTTDLMPLRAVALKIVAAWASCHLTDPDVTRSRTIPAFYKILTNPEEKQELRDTALEALSMIVKKCHPDGDWVKLKSSTLVQSVYGVSPLTLDIVNQLRHMSRLFPTYVPDRFGENPQRLGEQMLSALKRSLELSIVAQKTGQSTGNEIELCLAILRVYEYLPQVNEKFVEPAFKLVQQTERALSLEVGSPFRPALLPLMLRFPQHTVNLFLCDNFLKDELCCRWLFYLLKCPEGKAFREILESREGVLRLISIAKGEPQPVSVRGPGNNSQVPNDKLSLQSMAVRIVSFLVKENEQWIKFQKDLIDALHQVWLNDEYHDRHKADVHLNGDPERWPEPPRLARVLLRYFDHHPFDAIPILFSLTKAYMSRAVANYHFLTDYFDEKVSKKLPVSWIRQAFFTFADIHQSGASCLVGMGDPAGRNYPFLHLPEARACIIHRILMPCFSRCFEQGLTNELIGRAPQPESVSEDDVVSVYVIKVMNPENASLKVDCLRIMLLHFSSLIVDGAAAHFHDPKWKKHGYRLRRLMTYAWPSLMGRDVQDPTAKYSGHLFLSTVARKIAVHKKIVLQTFHSLLKATTSECRYLVRHCLQILTPAMPYRMDDDNMMLAHWTKKILMEDWNSIQQVSHILGLIVRQYKVYFLVSGKFVPQLLAALPRLGLAPSTNVEGRRLAVEVADVVLRWHVMFSENCKDNGLLPLPDDLGNLSDKEFMKFVEEGLGVTLSGKGIDKGDAEAIINFLFRCACNANEASTAEAISRRCVNLAKLAIGWWPAAELRLGWMEKLLGSITVCDQVRGSDRGDGPGPSQPGSAGSGPSETSRMQIVFAICVALDLLTYLVGGPMERSPEKILACIGPLQKSLALCLASTNQKVVRGVHHLMCKLMTIFPTEPSTSNVASKHEELDSLYAGAGKIIYEGLSAYDKVTPAAPSSLLSAILTLKAACSGNPAYLDRLISTFMRVLQRLVAEHLQLQAAGEKQSSGDSNSALIAEMIVFSFDLVKPRVAVLSPEMRKAFFSAIVGNLIEKTKDASVMKAIIEMTGTWVKDRTITAAAVNDCPSVGQTATILTNLLIAIQNQFSNDSELRTSYLELILYIYESDLYRSTEFGQRLETCFLFGLKCQHSELRRKFFRVFDSSVKRSLGDRLMYIVIAQNWEKFGDYYWLKSCIDLVLSAAAQDVAMELGKQDQFISPLVTFMSDGKEFSLPLDFFKDEPDPPVSAKELQQDLEELTRGFDGQNPSSFPTENIKEAGNEATGRFQSSSSYREKLMKIFNDQVKFLTPVAFPDRGDFEMFSSGRGDRAMCQGLWMAALSDMCRIDSDLAEHLWKALFPKVWVILNNDQKRIGRELVPFITSGIHVSQKNNSPSSIQGFVSAAMQCYPKVPVPPAILYYFGKSHNMWHTMALVLEDSVFNNPGPEKYPASQLRATDCYDFVEAGSMGSSNSSNGYHPLHDSLNALAALYREMGEEDLFASLWQQKKAKYEETKIALAYAQQGSFELAQGALELAQNKIKSDFSNTAAPPAMNAEFKLIEDEWIRYSRELNEWDMLLEFASAAEFEVDPWIALEGAWKVSPEKLNWPLIKEATARVELRHTAKLEWKAKLYRGYYYLFCSDEKAPEKVDDYAVAASGAAIREWRRLPSVVWHSHVNLLQASQLIIEMTEALHIINNFAPATTIPGRATQALNDLKSVLKNWRNGVPQLSDSLTHWSDLLSWRLVTFDNMTKIPSISGQNAAGEEQRPQQASTTNFVLGIQQTSQALLTFAKMARKHRQIDLCMEWIDRASSLPVLPAFIADYYQRVKQIYKCHLYRAASGNTDVLERGLEILMSAHAKSDDEVMKGDVLAERARFNQMLGRPNEALKLFSLAVQVHDCPKNWFLWGQLQKSLFLRDPSNVEYGYSAVLCYLHSAILMVDPKTRRPLSKVLCLLAYDNEQLLLAQGLESSVGEISPASWLPWIPQLLTWLRRRDGNFVLSILARIGRTYPQAVYFPVRTLFVTLKTELKTRRDLEAAKSAPATPATGLSMDAGMAEQTPESVEAMQGHGATPRRHDESMEDTQSQPMTPGVFTMTPQPMSQHPLTPRSQEPPDTPQIGSIEATTPQSVTHDHDPLTPQSVPQHQPMTPQPLTPHSEPQPGTPQPSPQPLTPRMQQPNTPQPVRALTPQPLTPSQLLRAMTPPQQPHTPQTSGQSLTPQPPDTPLPTRVSVPNLPTMTASMWRCSRIMHSQKELHPTILASFEMIIDQFRLSLAREGIAEDALRQLKKVLSECYRLAFEGRQKVEETPVPQAVQLQLKKIVTNLSNAIDFIAGANAADRPETHARSPRPAKNLASSASWASAKVEMNAEFNLANWSGAMLHDAIAKIRKWISKFEALTRSFSRSLLIDERCKYVINVNAHITDIELPGEFLLPKPASYVIKIARFLPRVDLVDRNGSITKRLYIRGHNGRVYPYFLVNDTSNEGWIQEDRVLQLLRFLNYPMSRHTESARRFLNFVVPKAVSMSLNVRFVEDHPTSLSLLDIFRKRIEGTLEGSLAPVDRYYELLSERQTESGQCSNQHLVEIFREIQAKLVPKTLVKDWALSTYPNATSYWTFRRSATHSLALLNLVEWACFLKSIGPDNFIFYAGNGSLVPGNLTFDVSETTGELVSNHPVPFRLTPNIVELCTEVGLKGQLVAAMIAAARSLVEPYQSVQSIICAVLRDELLSFVVKTHSEAESCEPPIDAGTGSPWAAHRPEIISLITKASNVVSARLQSMATFEGTDSKAATLVNSAMNPDNLCRMDPMWHPWL